MKNGFRAFDSDMHVYDAANLYEKYMNPKWGAHFPRALDEFFEIKDMSDGSRRKILWDNCARLYDLYEDKEQPK